QLGKLHDESGREATGSTADGHGAVVANDRRVERRDRGNGPVDRARSEGAVSGIPTPGKGEWGGNLDGTDLHVDASRCEALRAEPGSGRLSGDAAAPKGQREQLTSVGNH